MTNDYMANVTLHGSIMARGSQSIDLTPLHCFVGRHRAANAIAIAVRDAHYTSGRPDEADITSSGGPLRRLMPLHLRPLRIITPTDPVTHEPPSWGSRCLQSLGEVYPLDAAEVVEGLRKGSGTVQTLLVTNDPIILNELEPEEVSIVVDLNRGTEGGHQVTPISQTRNFADRIKAYKLGELWINYLHELGE